MTAPALDQATAEAPPPAARRARRSLTAAGLAAGAGVVAACSLPPWGFWPLGMAGVAGLALLLAGRPARGRALVGLGFGLGFFAVGLRWLAEFSAPGCVVVIVMEAGMLAAGMVLVPPGRGRWLALPGALLLVEAVRGAVPFGGLPMAGLALGQAGSPLGGAAHVGGPLLVLALVAAGGVAVAAAASRRWGAALVAGGVVAAGIAIGPVAPHGGGGPVIHVAAVQGGGRRGFTRVEGEDPADVLARHLAATTGVRPPVDLVLWPEDVIDVEGSVTENPEGRQLAAVASAAGATLVAGVVEGAGPERFRNEAVVWSPDGTVVDRYDKAHRVPFGEYVPARGLFEHLGDLSPVPRDAIAGRRPGLLHTPAGDLGVMVSYEVFFAHQARGAVRAGGRLLLVPTNASSYPTTQVPTQQVASARLRAIETGRDLVQAAPTGYSAVIDHRGRVLARSVLGRQAVLQRSVTLRSGRTLYVRFGDGPVLVLAVVAVAGGWALERSARGARRPEHVVEGDGHQLTLFEQGP
ncbi:MAG TPA: apolipoprotein N-acyltransferase [Acidimicrobiales bacterium]|nr:apolipoprotein N-acyltransferase [Acidimicrobiales bacterium]